MEKQSLKQKTKNKRFNRIYIEITNKCNLACSFCSKQNRPLRELSVTEFSTVINKIKEYTNTVCLHVKGEPLLHSHLNEILSICDTNNINVNLTTNGTLLKNKIDALKKHKCLSKIHISLNAETKNLAYLDDLFEVVSFFSQEKIIVYRLWAEKSSKLSLRSTKIVEKLKKYYHLSTEIVENIKNNKNTKIDINKYVDKALLFKWPTVDKNITHNSCEGLKSQLAILSDGTVTACCLDSDGKINLGNIFEEDLTTILNKEKTINIIKGFQNNKCTEKLCQSCLYKKRFTFK